jgi:hypothetical protein
MNCCDNNCRQGRDCPARKAYTGPAKPIPTHRELISDRAELIWFAVLALCLLCLLPWL